MSPVFVCCNQVYLNIFLPLISILIFFTLPQLSTSKELRLVALFGKPNSVEEKVIDFAYDEYKQSQIGPMGKMQPIYGSELVLDKVYIDPTDMVNITSTMCKKLNESAGMFYSGTSSFPIPSIIQSYADAFNVAHVTFQTGHSQLTKAFEVQPKLTDAVQDLIKFLQWNRFAIIYDEKDTLEAYSALTSIVNTIEPSSGNNNNNRGQTSLKYVFSPISINNSLNEIQKSEETNLILFLSRDNTEMLFKQAKQKQMLTQKYNYVIADLRMPCRKVRFDISGKINITCFQLIEQTSKEFKDFVNKWKAKNFFELDTTNELEAALAFDSFTLMKTVASHIDVRSYPKYGGGASSRPDNQQPQYKSCLGLKNTMIEDRNITKKIFFKVKISGVTGNIEFDMLGNRQNFLVQLLDVGLMEVHSRVGNWSHVRGELVLEADYKKTKDGALEREESPNELIDIRKRSMRVTAVMSNPFTMLKPEFKHMENDTASVRKEHLEGFLIDVMSLACSNLGLEYEILLVKDGRYGGKNPDGTWNGMIGELLRGEADVALAPLTITSMRQQVVDFTKPYMTLGISIMMQKPQEKDNGIFSFLHPLHQEIWMCCIFAYLSVSVVLFLVSRFSSADRVKNQVADSGGDEPVEFHEDLGIINCLWFSLGSFMQQGGDICPKSMPGRIVASSWWFFTLIIISSYTANLAAFLTVDRMKSPIKGAEDLAAQTQIEYGTLDQSSSQAFFEKSQVGTYQRMFSFMKDKKHFTESTAEGVKMVQNDPKFAFLMESSMMEYYNQQKPCNTMKVGPNLNVINYGLATPKESPYLKMLTIAILELQEKNEIDKLKEKWWYLTSPCGVNSKSAPSASASGAAALKINRVRGVFYLLTGTIIIGIIIASVEIVYTSFKQSTKLGPVAAAAALSLQNVLGVFYILIGGIVAALIVMLLELISTSASQSYASNKITTKEALIANWRMAFNSKYDVTKGIKRQLKESGKSGEFSEQSFCTTVTANHSDWPVVTPVPMGVGVGVGMGAPLQDSSGLYRSASSVGLYAASPTTPQQVMFAQIPQDNQSFFSPKALPIQSVASHTDV